LIKTLAMSRVKHYLKTALCALYKYSGLAPLQEHLTRWAGRHFMVILLFHRVSDAVPEDGLTVGTARFRRMCALLRHRFHVVPLGEVFRILRERLPIPPRTVAITFDDCYRDNLIAARILAETQLPACFFLPTDFVGTDHVFPWDQALPRLPNLTWDDVRELARMGFEIGSHTVTHANFGTISVEQARRELAVSRTVLEEHLRQPVRWFAYPYGGVNNFRPELLPLLEETGYQGGLSGHGGFIYPGADARLLPREPVPYFKSILNLELHLAGVLNWMYALKRRLGLQPPILADPEQGAAGRAAESAEPVVPVGRVSMSNR
jgi:peptidoglycan/xylan/chitin deacetylase (PgdA/CDA1 family)